MTFPIVEVAAPSRLHFGLFSFGLFSFGDANARQFGGAGVMIDRPGIQLRFEPADRWSVVGPLAARAEGVARQLAAAWRLRDLPACRLQIVGAAEDHVGLGTGTQLALSVAAGMNALLGRPELSPLELATLTGRGARSAIGTYGFCQGGLLIDAGKMPDEPLATLARRVELPRAWRFLLITPEGPRGLSGEHERAAFGELPPVEPATADHLRHLACDALLPAAEQGDFAAFGQALYEFGYQAGLCFAPRQGGPFASPRIAQLVDTLRHLGVSGVGQSSWGPTVFALCADEHQAEGLQAALRPALGPVESARIVRPTPVGAMIQVLRPALPARS